MQKIAKTPFIDRQWSKETRRVKGGSPDWRRYRPLRQDFAPGRGGKTGGQQGSRRLTAR
jgi:hypothetical protein